MINKILYFIAGAAIGSAVTYFLMDKKIKEERAKNEEDIAEIREMYKEGRKKEANDKVKENEAKKEELLEKINSKPETKDIPDEEFEKAVNDELGVLSHKYKEIIRTSGYYRREKIEVIDYDQYNDPNYNDYHKEEAYSYYQDGTVSDELDGELDWRDIENTVGVDFMAYFRDNPDEDLCYVRNNENRVDYTIQRVEGYYETTIDLADNLPDDNELEGEE